MLIQEEYFKNIFNTVRGAILILDGELRVLSANRSFFTIFKVDSADTIGSLLYDLGNGQWNIPHLRVLLEDVLPMNDTVDDYEIEHDFESIGHKTMLLNACKIREKKDDQPIILLAIEDITERKRLEELLKDSEERYRRLFETASDGIVLLEKREGTITHANPATEKMLGYSKEECIGKNLQDIGVPIDMSDFPAIMQTLNRNGIINYDDVEVKTKSGHTVDTDIYLVDRAMLAQCNIRDVSERKRKEEDIQRLSRTLVARSNSSKSLINARDESWYLNEVCRIIVGDCGHALVWIGFAEQDKDKTVTPVAHAGFDEGYLASKNFTWSDTERGRGPIGTSIRTGKPSIVRDIPGSLVFAPWREEAVNRGYVAMIAVPLLAEGKTFGSLNIYSPYQDPFSEDEVQLLIDLTADLSYGIAAIRQRTAKAEAESALQESELHLRTLVQTIPDLIWLKNEEGKYLACNTMFERFFGAGEKEIVGKTDYDFVDKEQADFFRENDRKAVAAGKPSSNREWVTFADDGHRALLDTIKTPMKDAGGKLIGVLGIGRDITEHYMLEEQLRHSQKMEAVGTMAGGIAHDFNNILNVIMGYGSMVIDKLEAGTPSREHMSEVLIATDRAAELTKRLLVFSRKQIVEVKPVNINGIILGLQKMLVRIIRESIDFNLHLADTPLIVLADAGQLEQVLINLASNAKDAMLEGGQLTIGTELEEMDDEYVAANGYGKPGRYALITVSDTGHGIDAETRKKIFEPFFTTKGIGEGTGLGLAITYSIIKQHGGFINVYSEPGQGTVFRIYMPLSAEEATPDKSPEAAIAARGGDETVLLAEDDASLRHLAVEVLESYGYTVISAENGEDAIIKFMENRERISLALLDMIMPKKNGKEVRDAIRKVSPGIKILFSSGYTMDIIKTRELMETDFDFIHKPFLPKDLLMKVREVLDR